MSNQRILIIGGGLIGLGTAYRLAQRKPGARITVLEKESRAGQHQSGNNSGVLHAGTYYKPGSEKARLAVRGLRQMTEFCRENGIAYEICGKLIVATSAEEVPRLKDLFERGTRNGLEGLRMMEPAEFHEIEPHAAGLAALRVPQEGIVDYKAVAGTLVGKIRELGGEVKTGAQAVGIYRSGGVWTVETPIGGFYGEILVNCAGLHSDRIAQMAGEAREVRIVPFRGEYYKIRPERQYLVRNLIYPVPDPAFPFLGVHYTRLIHGGIEAGPNAVLAFAREGYHKSDVNVRDLADAIGYPGLWRFLARYPRMCWHELKRSFSRELFCAALQRLVPEIRPEDLAAGGAGVRAQAMDPGGKLVDDFRFVTRNGAVHVLNAPSPGATASLAIGEEIAAKVEQEIG